MRLISTLVALMLAGHGVRAQTRTVFELNGEVRPYEFTLLPQLAGLLVDRDCTALYAPSPRAGCVYYQGEEFWIHASLKAKADVRIRPDAPGLATGQV